MFGILKFIFIIEENLVPFYKVFKKNIIFLIFII